MRKATTKNFWINHFKNFESSGLSQIEYCKKNNLNHKTFSAQKTTLKYKRKANTGESLFLKYEEGSTELEFTINNKISLKFKTLPTPQWTAQLIQSISSLHVD